MSTPILLLILGQGFKEAWYQLSEEEQENLWKRAQEIDRKAGAVWRILCDSRWDDESVANWGVIEYPDIDAYREKVAELEKIDWWRYWSCKTILGTEMDLPQTSEG